MRCLAASTLGAAAVCCYASRMENLDPEDRFIRSFALLLATGVVTGILAASTVVMVLVSANFNILNWME